MTSDEELEFRIDAFTPETIPMERLAEYMSDLATLLGETNSVHFVRLEGGSTRIVHRIEREAVPKVRARVREVRDGRGPADARKAAQTLDSKLRVDNASGALIEPKASAIIIQFPGARRATETVFGPFNQHGTLDGKVIRVGGVGDPVPITLEVHNGYQPYCYATREIAKELGQFLFDKEIRFTGMGRWERDATGKWTLLRFVISGYEVLDEKTLAETVIDLRSTPDTRLRSNENLWRDAADLRDDE